MQLGLTRVFQQSFVQVEITLTISPVLPRGIPKYITSPPFTTRHCATYKKETHEFKLYNAHKFKLYTSAPKRYEGHHTTTSWMKRTKATQLQTKTTCCSYWSNTKMVHTIPDKIVWRTTYYKQADSNAIYRKIRTLGVSTNAILKRLMHFLEKASCSGKWRTAGWTNNSTSYNYVST